MACVWALAMASLLHSQGMVSSGAAAMPRGKSSGKPWPVSFVDATAEAGLRFTYTYGNPVSKKYVVEANGSGTAFVDFDEDGLLDIFLINGTQLEPGKLTEQPTNRLFRNAGNGRFTDVTARSGLAKSGWG